LQIVSSRDLSVLKTYVADTPLNTAAITPKKDFVILGGGQAAMDELNWAEQLPERVSGGSEPLSGAVSEKPA